MQPEPTLWSWRGAQHPAGLEWGSSVGQAGRLDDVNELGLQGGAAHLQAGREGGSQGGSGVEGVCERSGAGVHDEGPASIGWNTTQAWGSSPCPWRTRLVTLLH